LDFSPVQLRIEYGYEWRLLSGQVSLLVRDMKAWNLLVVAGIGLRLFCPPFHRIPLNTPKEFKDFEAKQQNIQTFFPIPIDSFKCL
jgi:hypothetical protein